MPEALADIESIARAVCGLDLPGARAPVVGISGFGGAGKSTLAGLLQQQLAGAAVVPGDEFLRTRPPVERSDDWNAVDRDRLVREVLGPARLDGAACYQVLDPTSGALGPWVSIDHPTAFIVEGLGLYVPELVGLFDLRIWIDLDLDTSTRQGMWRDEHEYGNAQTDLWTDVWKPNDLAFFHTFRPDRSADILFTPGPGDAETSERAN